MSLTALVQAGAGSYVHWGWFSISLTNLLIIAAMLVVFVLALVVPFGHGGGSGPASDGRQDDADRS